MPRSQCENENVQFVQELAEVDGPFESPININYRDLTKLELPSLCWNRSEVCPQKMKITNTGHTVIISGKWKRERPYLTGGPLTGKYVFSQIHFHWGQDECFGSEHKVCGEGFPLEMHVAHFKTDYLSQENALKEKDGMVVVAYLFKLQDEPNLALKKIISSLPCVQQSCTSQSFEPRPIMSLLNPFTDDYFMYWGSVITPTCAHILLWLICREPFGISREQVEEFRKILDSSQHPIRRNSRDIQPLHKRNVFHVNACRDLDNPLLPVKQMPGCFCKGSEEDISFRSEKLDEQSAHDCSCPAYFRNQEEIEGITSDNKNMTFCPSTKGAAKWDSSLPESAFIKQYVYIQNAIISPAPLSAKKFESEMIRKVHYPVKKQIKSEDAIKTNFVSQSCCFFPMKEISQIKPRPDKRKNQEKKKSNSFKAFSNILRSLEALKNQTFKKLKEIDAINHEIKGMKSLCQNAEDKRWLRKIEKVMVSQKRFTIKKSHNCFGELKKLARECNFDKLFDNKQFSTSHNCQKIIKIKNKENRNTEITERSTLPFPEPYEKKAGNEDNLTIEQTTLFSLKVQKLVRTFFEDFKDKKEFQKTLQKNLPLKEVKSVDEKNIAESKSISKGYITQKMFITENLGDRFFTEVTTEVDTEEKIVEEVVIAAEEVFNNENDEKSEKKYKIKEETGSGNESIVPLRRATELSKLDDASKGSDDSENSLSVTESQLLMLDNLRDTTSTSDDEYLEKDSGKRNIKKKKPLDNYLKKLNELTEERLKIELKAEESMASLWHSNFNFSENCRKPKRMFIAKLHKPQSKARLWKRKSLTTKTSSKRFFDKSYKSKEKNFSFEGYDSKNKKCPKNETITNFRNKNRETEILRNKSEWKRFVKNKLELATEKSFKSGSSNTEMEYRIISPRRKKLKMDTKKKSTVPIETSSSSKSREILTDEDVKTVEKYTDTIIQEGVDIVPELAELADEPSKKYQEAVTQTAIRSIETESLKGQQCSRITLFRTTSTESKNNLETSKTEKTFEEDEVLVKMSEENPKTRIKKLLVKNKSLTSLSASPSLFSSKYSQRVFVENINSRRNSRTNPFDLKKARVPQITENCIKSPDTPEKPGDEEKIIKQEEDFLRPMVTQADEELVPNNQIQKEKSRIPLVKRGAGQKYGYLRGKRKEAESPKQQPIEEASEDIHRSVSKTSSMRKKVKDDECLEENGELETSTIFSSIKKNSACKSFSAESLNSLSRPFRRKNRKRPHIGKRSSKHYIKKSSLHVRKPKKVESKFLPKKNSPNEEQLKSATLDSAEFSEKTFVGYERQSNSKKNIVRGTEEIVLKNLKITKENPEKVSDKEKSRIQEKKANKDASRSVKKPERKIPQLKQDIKSMSAANEVPKEISASPKPTHDFIKRNKLMAGKYKRGPAQSEKPTEVKLATPKPNHVNKKNFDVLPKEPKEACEHRLQPDSTKPKNVAGNVTDVREKPTKIPKILGKFEKTQKKSASFEEKGVANLANQEESEKLKGRTSEVVVQKMYLPNSHYFPAYMMTSDLSPPMEIVENQQKQLNKYLLSTNMENHAPEMLKGNMKKEKFGDFFYKKDLEYLLTLQKCVDGEVPNSKEKSTNFMTKLLCQESNGLMALADASTNESFEYYEPLDYPDPSNNGVVLIEMNDLLDSSTSNSDLSGYFKLKDLDSLSQQLKNTIYISKAPQDSGDPGIVNPIVNCNGQEEWHSDSNYDCQIFISLSSNSNEVEGRAPFRSTTEGISNDAQEITNQSSTYLERNSSQTFTLKQQRKKRKENEISAEMKEKLLEILEAEIKREIRVKCSSSTETPSEGQATYNLEDSEENQRSQSAESIDNVEVLAQISETMKQYLSNFNEIKFQQSSDEAE